MHQRIVHRACRPQGYPLWTVLYMVWIWMLRAYATPAYLANLLTVLLSVGASVVLVLCVRQYVHIALEHSLQPSQHEQLPTRATSQQQLPKKSRSKPRQQTPAPVATDLDTAVFRDGGSDALTDIGLWAGLFASGKACACSHPLLLRNNNTSLLSHRTLLAGLYSFSPQIWHYANQAEVFALNNLLCALILYVAALYFQRPTLRLACLQAFVCGCALSNQHTSVLFVVPVAVSTLLAAVNEPAPDSGSAKPSPRVLSVWGFVLMSVCALAGLSFYLHLPIAAYREALDSWGDHSTLSGFLTHFLRCVDLRSIGMEIDTTRPLCLLIGMIWRQGGVRNVPARERSGRGAGPQQSTETDAAVCGVVVPRHAAPRRAARCAGSARELCDPSERVAAALLLLCVLFCLHEHALEPDLQVSCACQLSSVVGCLSPLSGCCCCCCFSACCLRAPATCTSTSRRECGSRRTWRAACSLESALRLSSTGSRERSRPGSEAPWPPELVGSPRPSSRLCLLCSVRGGT